MENDMARDFGFDISMPDGNVGMPSAAHKLFMERCKILYREFMTNMSVHMKMENILKKSLRGLHEEKIRNMRFSLYRSESADPFARRPEVESSTAFLDSRVNTPWGLDIIPDDEEQPAQRPQTAPAVPIACRKGTVQTEARPKTAGTTPNEQEDTDSDSGLSDMGVATKSTVMGVVDKKTELGSNRKITVGQHSFTKITHGNVTAKLKHKDGKFVVKPVKVDLDREAASSDTIAYDPSVGKHKFDPVTERLALVRKITDYRTPTISSDMKINNRVPIQKCLRGIDAKRTTISDIYQSARDRSSRHFRIVTNKPERKVLNDEREIKGRTIRPGLSNRWVKALRASFSVGPSSLLPGTTPATDKEGFDDNTGQQPSRPRSILLYSGTSGGSKGLSESMNAKELAESAFMGMYQDVLKRPQSKVAFTRADSQMSNEVFVSDSVDAVATANKDPTQSSDAANSATGRESVHGMNKKMFLSPTDGRHRSHSRNSESELRSRASSVSRSERRNRNDSNGRSMDRQLSGSESTKRTSKQYLLVNDGPHTDRLSVSSSGTSANVKNGSHSKKQTDPNGKTAMDKLSVSMNAPAKLKSSRDTRKIVKQQMRMDKVLDERMAVWRRRMTVKSTAMNFKLRPPPRRGKMSLI